jgi:hypothetical protein
MEWLTSIPWYRNAPLSHTSNSSKPISLPPANSFSAHPALNSSSSAPSHPPVTSLMPPSYSAKSKTHQPRTGTPSFAASPPAPNPRRPSHGTEPCRAGPKEWTRSRAPLLSRHVHVGWLALRPCRYIPK